MTNYTLSKQMLRKARVRHVHLFHFTDKEELMIERAEQQAKEFMRAYGRGRRTRMVDYSHYANSNYYRHEEKEQQ